MSKKRTPNVEAINDVITQIKSRPKSHFNMQVWASPLGWGDAPGILYLDEYPLSQDGEVLICKTALCLAGWTCATSPVKADRLALMDYTTGVNYEVPRPGWLQRFTRTNTKSVTERAAQRLGIPEGTARKLFHTDSWPQKVQDKVKSHRWSERTAGIKLLEEIRDGGNPWAEDERGWLW